MKNIKIKKHRQGSLRLKMKMGFEYRLGPRSPIRV